MTDTLCSVNLKRKTGLPKDVIVNDWVVDVAEPFVPAVQGPVVLAAIQSFYTHVNGAGHSVQEYLSATIDPSVGAHTFKMYDLTGHLDGSPHGSPVFQGAMTIGHGFAFNPLPAEVAAVLTIRANGWDTALVERPDADAPPDLKKDRPRQRLSGRIFVGPLDPNALTVDGMTFEPSVHSDFRTALLDGAEWMYDQLELAGHNLAQWSRKNAQVTHVVAVQVDNAFDTIRSRGNAPAVRTTRVVEP